MKHLQITPETKLTVGMKLWDVREGEVIITSLEPIDAYPIKTKTNSYNLEGKLVGVDKYPILYLSNLFENQFPRMMEVSIDGNVWEKRKVLFIEDYEYFTLDRYSSNIIVKWRFAREVQEPEVFELTIDDIARKFNIDASLIKIVK